MENFRYCPTAYDTNYGDIYEKNGCVRNGINMRMITCKQMI